MVRYRPTTSSVARKRKGPIPTRVPLPVAARQLRIERTDNDDWIIWLAANGDFTIGTFIRLNTIGLIEAVHLHPDGTEEQLALYDGDS